MPRHDINRSGEMAVFVAVIENGGFSAAARKLQMTPSAVSKLVGRLEARLGARLVNRSTRTQLLTSEGRTFYEKSVRILADMDEAEQTASAGDAPRGLVRINTSASYGTHILAPILARLMDEHPGLSIDLVQTDLVVDLLSAQTDIAVRAGPLSSSSLVARKLGETPLMIVGSPDYLERRGVPRTAEDLERHSLLGFGYVRSIADWSLPDRQGQARSVPVTGRISASDGEALRQFAIHGAGLVRLAGFTVEADIAAGRLVEVLGGPETRLMEAFHAVYVGQGGLLPARVRAVLDFLAAHGRVH